MYKKYNSGEKFGRLTILGLHHKNKNNIYYNCACDCGKNTIVSQAHLSNGHTKSCGCLSIEKAKERPFKHGLIETRLYSIFTNMKTRCYNKNNLKHKRYGGRGIIICDEWKNDFMNFYNWALKNGYSDDLTIDRIDCDGIYCPENCRWVSVSKNSKNKKSFIISDEQAEEIRSRKNEKIRDLAKEYNCSPSTIWQIRKCLIHLKEENGCKKAIENYRKRIKNVK